MADGGSGGREALQHFLASNPDTGTLEVMTVDLGGILRGKRVPRSEWQTLFTSGLTTSGATPLVNTLGEVPLSIDQGNQDGDPDKIIRPVTDTLAPVTWLETATGQTLASYWELDGTPCAHDPRHVLQQVTSKLAQLGLTPMVALELEFYLLEPGTTDVPRPWLPTVPGTTLRQQGSQYGMFEDLWDLDTFLSRVNDAAAIQDIPLTTTLAEYSPGQFEINLHHVDNPVRACDHAVLLKRLIKGIARQQGGGASFMAKPFADIAGCGQHVHLSLYDADNNNVFSAPSAAGTPGLSATLHHAIGGLQAAMAESMPIFAPNANSYRRLIPGEYVPLTENWGYNHRNVALRIPVSDAGNLRIEHRVAGADANPYLVVAAILAGLHHGISNRLQATAMVSAGQVLDDLPPTLPRRWDTALDRFADGKILPGYLGDEYAQLYAAIRRDECERFHSQVTRQDYEWYLRAV